MSRLLVENIRHEDASTDALVLDNAGNISVPGTLGIGTASPSAKLHVKSTGTGNVFYVESSDGHHLGGFYQESDTRAAFNVRDASGNVKVNLDAGGDSWFTGGNVGIGYTSPNEKLHVNGYIEASSGFKLASHPVLDYTSFDGGYATRLGSTGTSTLDATQIFAGGSVQATFKGGNVGIGTASPDTKLHVYNASGNTYAKLESNANNTRSALLPWAKKSDGSTLRGYIGVTGDANKMEVATSTNDSIHFYTNNNPTNNGIFLKADGNVGIGTSNPNAKLDISASSVPAAGTNDTDLLVAFAVDGNTHGRIDLHTTAKNSSLRSAVYRPNSSTAYGYGYSAYNMGTLDIGRVDQGYTWNGTNGDGEYTGGLTQQPRYTRKAHFSGTIIGNNTYYTIAENMNDTRFIIECFCGDASSRDYKKYAGYYTSTGYGVYGLNQLLHSNGSWNSGNFDMRVSAPNGNLSIDLRFSSYYNSANIASWICIYTGFV